MKTVFLIIGMCIALTAQDNFTLESFDLKGQLTKVQEFDKFGCNGKNISPELSWRDAQKVRKVLLLLFMTPMHRQAVDGGIGLW